MQSSAKCRWVEYLLSSFWYCGIFLIIWDRSRMDCLSPCGIRFDSMNFFKFFVTFLYRKPPPSPSSSPPPPPQPPTSPSSILVNNQPDALFNVLIYFTSLYVSSNPVLITRRIELYQYIIWYISLCVRDCLVCWSGPAYQAVTYTEWHIPDDALIQLIPLMMSTGLFETYREVK